MPSIAEILLISGVVTTVVFVAVLLIEGALRPGYNPVYHTGSELELGKRGWIMRANFLIMALGMIAFAVGIYLRLNTVAGAVLLVIFSFGLIIAGVFAPDPVRGYPPGATSQAPAKLTRRHQVHHASGPIMFLALFAACLVLSARLQGVWQLYTVLTVVAGFTLMIWLVLAYEKNAAHTGLVQRALILVCWSWIVLLVIHLIQHPPQP